MPGGRGPRGTDHDPQRGPGSLQTSHGHPHRRVTSAQRPLLCVGLNRKPAREKELPIYGEITHRRGHGGPDTARTCPQRSTLALGNLRHLNVVHAGPSHEEEEGGRFQRNKKWQERVRRKGSPQREGRDSARPPETGTRSCVPGKPRDRDGPPSVCGKACPPRPQAARAQGPGPHAGRGDARSRPFPIHPRRLDSPERNETTAPTAPTEAGGQSAVWGTVTPALRTKGSPCKELRARWAAPDSVHKARTGTEGTDTVESETPLSRNPTQPRREPPHTWTWPLLTLDADTPV